MKHLWFFFFFWFFFLSFFRQLDKLQFPKISRNARFNTVTTFTAYAWSNVYFLDYILNVIPVNNRIIRHLTQITVYVNTKHTFVCFFVCFFCRGLRYLRATSCQWRQHPGSLSSHMTVGCARTGRTRCSLLSAAPFTERAAFGEAARCAPGENHYCADYTWPLNAAMRIHKDICLFVFN